MLAVPGKKDAMAKEMIISSSAHEKKIAIVEDGIVTEYYVERADENQALVGNIYKGRVMKVLPGMQSAFVNIGLDRDAFLYVSDFFEESLDDDTADFQEERLKIPPILASLEEAGLEALVEDISFTPENTAGIVEEDRLPEESFIEDLSVAPDLDDEVEEVSLLSEEDPDAGEELELLESAAFVSLADTLAETLPDLEDTLDELAEVEPTPTAAVMMEAIIGATTEPLAPLSVVAEESLSPAATTSVVAAEVATPSPVVPVVPQVIIPPPNPDYIRIQDDPDEEPAAVPQPSPRPTAQSEPVLPVLVAIEESEEEPEVEKEPARRPRRGKKEALRKAPARRRTKKDAEKQVEATAVQPTVESTSDALASLERIIDEEASPVAKSVPIETAETTVVSATVEVTSPSPEDSAESSPEVRVGSLQLSNDSTFERIVDAEQATAASQEPAEASLPTNQEVPSDVANQLLDDRENDGGEEEKSAYKPSTVADSRKPSFSPRRGGRRRGRRSNTYHSGYNRGQGEESLPPEKIGEAREVVNNNLISNLSRQPGISDLLREGQEILVQIAKEPIALKGARITSHIALPGRYLVYMPTVNHIGVSRKIPSDAERLRLKRLITMLRDREKPQGGFIVRTACENRSEEELHEDMLYLARTWQEIKRKAERGKAPALICRELDLVERTLRDQLSGDITAIRVDNEFEYTRVIDFVNRFQPKLVNRVKLYMRKRPIFEECGVQDDLDKAIRPRVWLNSGGYIVINQTEALVAIDVNTGKFVGRSNRLEDTITKTNLEAVREIVRQIRLRDLGGIIILDFIDMEERKNRLRVMQALEAELKADRAPSKVLQFNDFGLVAITRKRVRQSLERTLCSPCPYCHGAGLVKSPQTVCYEILAEARRVSAEMEITPGMDIILRVHPHIAEALRSTEKKVLHEIEAYLGIPITVKGDLAVHQERYDFAIL
jgi:ribonuclease G